MSGSAAGAPTPVPPAPGDLVAAAVADALAYADHAAANLAKAAAGTYTSADAAADAAACVATTATWAGRLAGAAWLLPQWLFAPPPLAPQPSSRVPGAIDENYRNDTLSLQTAGFRAIGYGADYFIDATHITFEPPTVEAGLVQFIMVVDWHSLPPPAKKITIVYEGEVTSVQKGSTQVCDPIRFVKPAFAR